MEDNVQNPEKGQQISAQEFELVQQLIKSRMENGQELKYESLDGYEVPPRTQFSMLKKPAVTIKDGKMNFNMACIRLFESVQYIIPIVHEQNHKLAVIPCVEEESASIDWARLKNGDTWVNKQVTNRDLVSKIGKFMKWDTRCRYKILGEVRMSARGLILVFDLDEAIMFESHKEEYIDEETGQVKIKKKDIKYYPDKYQGRIGMSYSDYMESRQMNLFEDFSNYFSQDGSSIEELLGTEEEVAPGTDISAKDEDITFEGGIVIAAPDERPDD